MAGAASGAAASAGAAGAAPIDVAGYAGALADGIEAALPGWVEGCVASIMTAWSGAIPAAVAERARLAGQAAATAVGPRVRALLEADIDEQRSTPLAILRAAAVSFPTSVLMAAGVPPVVRDRAAEELFPDDIYDLVPASFGDLGPDLADAGLRWGAAKAFEHKRRHGGRK